MSLWRGSTPLVLASASSIRRSVLEAAGIPVEVRPADIDERSMEARAQPGDAVATAALLARKKALAVAQKMAERLVLAADQTLALETRRFAKPSDRTAAHEQFRALSGKTHTLNSAVAIVRNGEVLFEHVDIARLTMRPLSDQFIEAYLDAADVAVTASVGGYQLEAIGIHLFEQIEGDHFTILGLPLLPVLNFLRREGYLAG
jgi:septum formation protein